MSEKLCLQWNDFKENVNTAFGSLREDKDFSDVTLACEDGQQVEAHKVILAASSPFFQNLLKRNKHPHPLIYMRGVQSLDLVAIIDFLYFGEANVCQENLDSFLVIAEELKLKGLTGQKSSVVKEEDIANAEPVDKIKEFDKRPKYSTESYLSSNVGFEEDSRAVIIPNLSDNYLDALDTKVKSMMERSKNMFPSGKQINGTPRQTTACICKVCGKEGHPTSIKRHIEGNHLEGISIPCTFCDVVCSTRDALRRHKFVKHKNLI